MTHGTPAVCDPGWIAENFAPHRVQDLHHGLGLHLRLRLHSQAHFSRPTVRSHSTVRERRRESNLLMSASRWLFLAIGT